MSTKKGSEAEEKAVRHLKWRGYTILDRNVRGGSGELDIVARKADVIAFVEVKSRPTRESCLLAVHADKQRRLRSAAASWRSRNPRLESLQCRFDVIILTPGRWFPHIEYMRDAFR
ncbi:MAG: YraN family protein [Mariprofundaceae bacterium]|nr:YraN family protein [Mariprofundaceae bacterium]